MTELTIGIDHGNANIKTVHCVFPAAYMEMTTDQGYDETLFFNNKYYNLIEKYDATEFEKTSNDKYYILTIFAIIKEIKARRYAGDSFDINLKCGLPPGMMNTSEVKKFINYLGRKHTITFSFERKQYTITLHSIKVYPQGFSAWFHERKYFDPVQNQNIIIIDIGGGTTEYLILHKGKPRRDLITSEIYGTINFTHEIQRKIMNDFRLKISDDTIKRVMCGEDGIMFHDDVINTIRSAYNAYAANIFNTAKMTTPEDISFTDVFLTGGGALYFSDFFEKLRDQGKIGSLYVQNNIHANACGFEEYLV